MIPAYSLPLILKELDDQLGEFVTEFEAPSADIGFFAPGMPRRSRTVTIESAQWSKLVGILFCLPETPLGRNEILPNLDYFHHRSGEFVDFYCPGYGALWPDSAANYQDRAPAAKLAGVDWLFSAAQFNQSRAELQNLTKWRFSGETDLLLLVARKAPNKATTLDFSTAIACNLEEMLRDQAVSSVRAFFERIFAFGETYDGEDPVYDLSDALGIQQGKGFLAEVILGILPEPVRKLYKTSKHFVIQDIAPGV